MVRDLETGGTLCTAPWVGLYTSAGGQVWSSDAAVSTCVPYPRVNSAQVRCPFPSLKLPKHRVFIIFTLGYFLSEMKWIRIFCFSGDIM